MILVGIILSIVTCGFALAKAIIEAEEDDD